MAMYTLESEYNFDYKTNMSVYSGRSRTNKETI